MDRFKEAHRPLITELIKLIETGNLILNVSGKEYTADHAIIRIESVLGQCADTYNTTFIIGTSDKQVAKQ